VDETPDPFADRPDRTQALRVVLAEGAASVLELVGSPEVGREWAQASALEGMTVGGLAAHFTMGLRMTIVLLERERPETDVIATPFAFFGDNRREGGALDDERARWIAAASEEGAAEGQASVVEELTSVIAQVDAALSEQPLGHTIATSRIPDAVARLDDYLLTRIAEVVLHGDDLASSVGVVWTPPLRAADATIDLLVGMARERVGDLEVLRALAREERSAAGALRAL
jgi:hypothetical protein